MKPIDGFPLSEIEEMIADRRKIARAGGEPCREALVLARQTGRFLAVAARRRSGEDPPKLVATPVPDWPQ